MTTLDSMLERNKDFATSQSAARELMPRALPNVKAIIIGCADMRVDPAHVLGIKPGEAVVMRNIGGRITPRLLEQMGMLGRIGAICRSDSWRRRGVFISSSSNTPIAASLTSPAGPPCWRTIFKYRKGNSRKRPLPIRGRRLPSTLLCCGRFPHCRESGLSPASSRMTSETGLVEIVVPPAAIRSAANRAA